jgi:hypothetical protein
MRAKGINYDTGFLNAGTSTHEPFDGEVVQREMRVIRDDLHCTAVRVTGGDPDRLEIAATNAADAGLEIWFCPFTNGLTQDALLALLADCAERAERLRRRGAKVVFLTGSELSLFTDVDAAFVYTFARYDLPHRDDPHVDLDMASAGVVKVLDGQRGTRDPRDRRYPDMAWEPKAAFDALADCYGR